MGFAVPADHRVKVKVQERKKLDKYLELARQLKKAMEREDGSDTNHSWILWNILKDMEKRQAELEIWGKIKTIALLRLARILRRVKETWEDGGSISGALRNMEYLFIVMTKFTLSPSGMYLPFPLLWAACDSKWIF